jgi:hypothetical protein
MKTLGTLSLAVAFLLFAGPVNTYSQDRDDSHPGQAQDEKNKPKVDKDKDKHEVNTGAQVQQEDKHEHDQPGMKQDERHDHQMGQKEQRPDHMDRDHQQHPAGAKQGKKIPDDKFRSHFGRQHTFKVQRTQVINVSQPVVVYGGYNFQLVEAWPSVWGFEDPVYIDYVDGEYYMFDEIHPEIRIAVIVIG